MEVVTVGNVDVVAVGNVDVVAVGPVEVVVVRHVPVRAMAVVNVPAAAATSPLDLGFGPCLFVHLCVERCIVHIAGDILAKIAGILGDLLGNGSEEPALAACLWLFLGDRLVGLLVTLGALLALRLGGVYRKVTLSRRANVVARADLCCVTML